MTDWIWHEDGERFVIEPWQQAILARAYRRNRGRFVMTTTARVRHGRPARGRRLPHGRQRR